MNKGSSGNFGMPRINSIPIDLLLFFNVTMFWSVGAMLFYGGFWIYLTLSLTVALVTYFLLYGVPLVGGEISEESFDVTASRKIKLVKYSGRSFRVIDFGVASFILVPRGQYLAKGRHQDAKILHEIAHIENRDGIFFGFILPFAIGACIVNFLASFFPKASFLYPLRRSVHEREGGNFPEQLEYFFELNYSSQISIQFLLASIVICYVAIFCAHLTLELRRREKQADMTAFHKEPKLVRSWLASAARIESVSTSKSRVVYLWNFLSRPSFSSRLKNISVPRSYFFESAIIGSICGLIVAPSFMVLLICLILLMADSWGSFAVLVYMSVLCFVGQWLSFVSTVVVNSFRDFCMKPARAFASFLTQVVFGSFSLNVILGLLRVFSSNDIDLSFEYLARPSLAIFVLFLSSCFVGWLFAYLRCDRIQTVFLSGSLGSISVALGFYLAFKLIG